MASNFERWFLYTMTLVAMILLLHSGQLIFNTTTLIITHQPRPYFGPVVRRQMQKQKTKAQELDLNSYSRVMTRRVERIKSVCDQYGKSIKVKKKAFRKNNLMWDTHNHLVYCPIYKVASGTWTSNFLRLAEFNKDLPKWQRYSKLYNASEGVARKTFPAPDSRQEMAAELRTSTVFMVVRHPFDRILSAYKGKISRPDAKPKFYRKLQMEIKKKYSHNQQEIKDKVSPTFEEYWRYLIDITAGLEKPSSWRDVDCVQSFYSRCVPCDVNYTLILKLETHNQDSEYLIRTRNLTELTDQFVMWKHNSKGENSIGDYDYYIYDDPRRNPKEMPTDRESLKKLKIERENKLSPEEEKVAYKEAMFGQLTQQQMWDLYENYKVDFQMFDYNIDDFLPLALDHDSQMDDREKNEEEEEQSSEREELRLYNPSKL